MSETSMAERYQAFSLASLVLMAFQVRWGWGRHTYYLLQTSECRHKLIQATKLSYINEVCTMFTLLFVKASISVLLLRIFGTMRRWRGTIYFIIAFVFVTTVTSVSVTFAQCRPLGKLWNPSRPGECWSPETAIQIGYYNGGQSTTLASFV